MKQLALNWRIVLVRPRNPLNIGAAARAMANFGFRDLMVVAPHDPVWQETRSAVGAENIIKSAQAVDNLLDAIGDATIVIGTTSGSRRTLDRELMPLQELPAWLAARTSRRARAALLFGSEKTGLSNDHLSYCHALVRIPTVADCSSMNLGQAVAVCCYELARARAVAARPPASHVFLSDRADLHSLEHVFERAVHILDAVGYLKPKSRAATLVKLRRVLLDLGLTNNDARILGGVLAQIEWKLRVQESEARSQKSE
ncbi:MAG: TrmJ/YjtD family RNA methyltransferase [Acidobacteriia bacterium]|nr:TrmJ/YjtD family RNA methyltransferase [Terriglobia bacterium]